MAYGKSMMGMPVGMGVNAEDLRKALDTPQISTGMDALMQQLGEAITNLHNIVDRAEWVSNRIQGPTMADTTKEAGPPMGPGQMGVVFDMVETLHRRLRDLDVIVNRLEHM